MIVRAWPSHFLTRLQQVKSPTSRKRCDTRTHFQRKYVGSKQIAAACESLHSCKAGARLVRGHARPYPAETIVLNWYLVDGNGLEGVTFASISLDHSLLYPSFSDAYVYCSPAPPRRYQRCSIACCDSNRKSCNIMRFSNFFSKSQQG